MNLKKGQLHGQSYSMFLILRKLYIWDKFQPKAEEISSQLKQVQTSYYKEVKLKLIEQYRKQMLVVMSIIYLFC